MIQRCILVLFALLLHAGAAAAQDLAVRGVVIGPDAKPVAGPVVVLHRVAEGGGATVAEVKPEALEAGDGGDILEAQPERQAEGGERS